MIFGLIVITCLASSALGQICCTPKQWERTEVVLKTRGHFHSYYRGSVERSIVTESYDAENNRTSVMANITSYFGKEKSIQVISDYVSMRSYYINLDEETCYPADLSGEFQENCIEEDYTLLSEEVLGVGDNTLSTTTYRKKNFFEHTEITVTGDCVPVSQIKFSGFGSKKVEYRVFTSMTLGIADLNIFTPPAYCNEASVLEMILSNAGGK